ncbi:MAG TPA: hypothetical protein VJN94_17360 [Candidatus Binataceae bacterium]|nr:hypothetical protein [Candidatus Binataceae bacterium]
MEIQAEGAAAAPVRIGPVAAIGGALLLFIGTWMHPMNADPNDPLAAFAEYAAADHWVTSHLLQLFGVLLMSAALVLLLRRLDDGRAAVWAVLGTAGAIAGLAAAAALQAVDGVALKVMVDHWALAPAAVKPLFLQAAFAVRQIEVGLASVTSLLFGLTVSAYGVALWLDRRFPRWIAALAIAGGVPTALAGVAIAYSGFSDLAMGLNLPAGSLLILLMLLVGGYGWRHPVF